MLQPLGFMHLGENQDNPRSTAETVLNVNTIHSSPGTLKYIDSVSFIQQIPVKQQLLGDKQALSAEIDE